MAEQATTTESDILAEVIAPEQGNLTAEVAESILAWKFTDQSVRRMSELAQRNSQGTITPEERQLLERYLRVGSLINVVQAKARLSLKSNGSVGT
jgi:hypothetical protein